MFHVMGWGIPWAALMLGCKQVLPHRFMDTATILRLIADEGVTLSAGVPTIWQNIRSAVESDPDAHDLSSLSRVLCGGAAPSLSLIRWYWQALGVEMIQEWGMTEISPLATFSRRRMKHAHAPASDAEQFDHVAKAGLSLPGLELDIFDAEFRRLPHDGHAVGDILIRGPWVCAEYYRNPSRAAFHGDWLITGDVGRIDTDEYLIVSDRTKDLIKSGGEWISSLDLENHSLRDVASTRRRALCGVDSTDLHRQDGQEGRPCGARVPRLPVARPPRKRLNRAVKPRCGRRATCSIDATVRNPRTSSVRRTVECVRTRQPHCPEPHCPGDRFRQASWASCRTPVAHRPTPRSAPPPTNRCPATAPARQLAAPPGAR